MTSLFGLASRRSLQPIPTSKPKASRKSFFQRADRSLNAGSGLSSDNDGLDSEQKSNPETPSQSKPLFSRSATASRSDKTPCSDLRRSARVSKTQSSKKLTPKPGESPESSLYKLTSILGPRDFEEEVATSPLAKISSFMRQPLESSPDPVFKVSRQGRADSPESLHDIDMYDDMILHKEKNQTQPEACNDLPTGQGGSNENSAVVDDLHNDDAETAAQLFSEGAAQSSRRYNGSMVEDESENGYDSDVSFTFSTIISHRRLDNDPNKFELQIVWSDNDSEAARTWVQEEDIMMDAPNAYFEYWGSVGGRQTHVEDPDLWYMFNIKRERKSGRGKAYLIQWLGSREESWEPESSVKRVASELLQEYQAKTQTLKHSKKGIATKKRRESRKAK
ncbi:hypothetical protein CFIMG_003435RA [Ceratocystis fimbriata CBS 114723]|uniref:Chromo domain-containing protein n=1 Tax=Ceratocystis fimbriata CBS 114723 TaxID=1035309 RepID=A0A2C5WXS5_9PEZI|nr:hypothetical protein CFIMG_003435RA [Ceratocystis fimbriata CBS 114723]